MVVEIIAVGTEIILGNIVNTNAAFLSEQCAKLGLSLYYHTAVGDNRERLSETLQNGLKRSDILIVTGGLGPTDDDLTKETAADVMNRQLILDEHTKEKIEAYFKSRFKGNVPVNNYKQAYIPENAMILENDNGTAPGVIMEEEGKCMILLPGPPNELIPMFLNKAVPYLKKKSDSIILSQTVKLCGTGESAVEMELKDLIEKQGNPTIATYAKTGEVHIRITAKAQAKEAAEALITPVLREIESRFGSGIYTENEEVTLEAAIAMLLEKNHLTMATAESCTGGLVAGRLINVPGVSDVFMQGFITYSNKAKRKLLGVKKETLLKYGAVSEKTAKEMAKGGAAASKTDVCVSVTGIAGPDGGTADKPVGLVYIGCSVHGKTTVREYHFSGNRAMIREKTVAAALSLLRECLMRYEKVMQLINK